MSRRGHNPYIHIRLIQRVTDHEQTMFEPKKVELFETMVIQDPMWQHLETLIWVST